MKVVKTWLQQACCGQVCRGPAAPAGAARPAPSNRPRQAARREPLRKLFVVMAASSEFRTMVGPGGGGGPVELYAQARAHAAPGRGVGVGPEGGRAGRSVGRIRVHGR